MQIQINWLLQKPTDLDLHWFLRQGMSCSAREGLNYLHLFEWKLEFDLNQETMYGYLVFTPQLFANSRLISLSDNLEINIADYLFLKIATTPISMHHIYPKYWDTLSTYHTCPKIWNSPFYYLLYLKYSGMSELFAKAYLSQYLGLLWYK